jgi:hypothetical protein
MDKTAETRPNIEGSSGWNGLAWFAGALATFGAAVVATVLAIFFAATVAVIALMSAVVVGLGSLAWRARRSVRKPAAAGAPTILEARHVGGHSWVAYGWDQGGR